MSYYDAFRIIENEDGTKSVGQKVQLIGPGDAGYGDYLPLAGGTLTGPVTWVASGIDGAVPPASRDGFTPIYVRDKNNQLLGYIGFLQETDGSTSLGFYATKKIDNVQRYSGLAAAFDANGNGYSIGQTPPTDAPNNAVQTKESVARDFLSKTGGEVTGIIRYIITPSSNKQSVFNVKQTTFNDIQYAVSDKMITGENILAEYQILLSNGSRYAYLAVGIDGDDIFYSRLPYPRGLYVDDGATTRWVMDYAPRKLTVATEEIHINANTGSDTADLHNGRGKSEEKPFKSFDAAWNYIATNYQSDINSVTIILHSDVTTATRYRSNRGMAITITSDSTQRKITFGNNLSFLAANVNFKNVDIDMASYYVDLNGWTAPTGVSFSGGVNITGSKMAFNFFGNMAGMFASGSLSFNGTAGTHGLFNMVAGLACLEQTTISGNVTGKRYDIREGAILLTGGKGVNFIPGTEAGTTDASSVYA